MVTEGTVAALALAVGGAAFVAATGQGTRSGALAGLGVAAAAILGLGPGALFPLAIFVLGAGLMTRLGRARKEALGAAEANRGRRDVRHVAAKLGVPFTLGAAGILTGSRDALALAYAAALAGAFADTTATEVGLLAKGAAVGFRRGRFTRLRHGEAGAMSLGGLLASLIGAAAVGWGASISRLIEGSSAAAIATGAGFTATLLESVASGTVLGRSLGHFGRNALVSIVAAAVGYGAAILEWGGP